MKIETFLGVCGVVFAVWALGELYRVTSQAPAQVGALDVPIWPSYVGTALAVALFIWAFALVRKQH